MCIVAGAIFCHTRLAKCLGPGFCWRGLFRRACSTPSVASVWSGGRADHRAFPCDLPIRHSSRSLRSRETRRRLQRTWLLFCVLLKALGHVSVSSKREGVWPERGFQIGPHAFYSCFRVLALRASAALALAVAVPNAAALFPLGTAHPNKSLCQSASCDR